MASYCGSQIEFCFQLQATLKTIVESGQTCLRQFMEHQVFQLKDEHLDLYDNIEAACFEMRERQQNGQDITGLRARVEEMGERQKQVERQIQRELRKGPVAFTDIKPYIDGFMSKAGMPMDIMNQNFWVDKEGERVQPIPKLPPTPAADSGDDDSNEATLAPGNESPRASPPPSPPRSIPRSPPSSKRTTLDSAEDPPSPKRRVDRRDITTIAEIDESFSSQRITETPARSGEWYVFRCEEHGMPFDYLERPAQAAARHAKTHGFPPTHASAVDVFGIKVVGCDAAFAKSHNDRVEVRPRRGAGRHVDSVAVDSAYHSRHDRSDDRGNDEEMAQLLADINPSNPRYRPIRRAVANRKRTILSRDPDGTQKPAEITAKTIYWIKWPDDGLCYPAYVLPWEAFPRFRSKNWAPVDRGLLESVDQLPACYDRNYGFAGVWAEGYKDGQSKVNKREYPVIFFALEKRFPWECETGWAAAEDFRVYDGDKEDPQFKALVGHWRAREDRQTPDDELIRLKLMSPPLDQDPSRSSSSDRGSSQEESSESGDINEEIKKAFADLNRCLSSDRGSSRGDSSEDEDDDDDIGLALLGGARESQSRHTSSSLSQRRLQSKDTELHHRHRRIPMPSDDGTPPADRFNPDEDEESDIYRDDNVGPFPDKSPSEESDTESSRHDPEESPVRPWEYPASDDEYTLGENYEDEQDKDEQEDEEGIRFDEPSTPRRRVSSSEQRVTQAMASAARQVNAFWLRNFREYSKEADELSS